MDDRYYAFIALTKYYEQANSKEREGIRKEWDFGKKWKYPNQSTLANELNDALSSEERIKASLIYDSIEDFKYDGRENLVGLCIAYHSALEANLDPKLLFEDVAKISSDRVAVFIRQFLSRTDEDRSLKAFLLKKVVVDGRISIERDRDRRS